MIEKVIKTLQGIFKVIMNFLTNPVKMVKLLNKLRSQIREDTANPKAPVIKDKALWGKKCRSLIYRYIRRSTFRETLEVIDAFYSDNIICIKDFSSNIPDDEVILLVAVMNDSSRIEHLLKHYKKIGVKHFIFIDNGSEDGTIEKIMELEDTACYHARARFNSFRKAGWFNRIAAHYGANRWYIVIDSDELFAYPGMTQLQIMQYVKTVQSKQYNCVKAVMLDMYPDGPLMDEAKSDEEYLGLCTYFDRGDKHGYKGEYITSGCSVSGGMRTRLFYEDTGVLLTKPTLINYLKTFLLGPHTFYPDNIDKASKHGGAVLHYKFLPSDKERYNIRVHEGSYYNNSAMYKVITDKMERTPVINAMSEYSIKFDVDESWQYLPFIEDLTGNIGSETEVVC